jgi:hypothetical protein
LRSTPAGCWCATSPSGTRGPGWLGAQGWARVAPPEQQVIDNDLPVISKLDRRYGNGGQYHDAMETEALGQANIVAALRARLDDLLVCGSASGSETNADPGELKLISAAEAARILQCSREWICKIAEGLGGQFVGGQWVFPLQTVLDHAEGKRTS